MVALRRPEEILRAHPEAELVVPRNAMKRIYRGVDYFNKGNFEESLAEFEAANRLSSSDPLTLTMRGVARAELGQVDEALATFNEALKLSPYFFEAHFNKAVTLHRAGRIEDAATALENALKRLTDDDLEELKREIVLEQLKRLTRSGFASWSGGKPKGSDPPIEVTPGPPISDYIHEMRQ